MTTLVAKSTFEILFELHLWVTLKGLTSFNLLEYKRLILLLSDKVLEVIFTEEDPSSHTMHEKTIELFVVLDRYKEVEMTFLFNCLNCLILAH